MSEGIPHKVKRRKGVGGSKLTVSCPKDGEPLFTLYRIGRNTTAIHEGGWISIRLQYCLKCEGLFRATVSVSEVKIR